MGAFLAHSVSAYYNDEERLFMPPHRTLGFNPQIKIDDALLVSEYMRSDKLSFEDAEREMNKDLSILQKKISEDGIVHFGELGSFTMNIKGEISFKQNINGIDDPANFGFEPLSISLLRHCEETILIPIKRREIGKYIAIAVAVIFMFMFVTPVSDNARQKGLQASLNGFASSEQISMMQQLSTKAPEQIADNTDINICPVEYTVTESNNCLQATKIENSVTAEATKNSVSNSIETTVAPATADNSSTEVSNPMHYIIVASSPNESNAQLAVSELSTKLEADYTVVKCGKRHRIAVNKFQTLQDAQNALAQYQQTFPDAWILTH